MAIAGKPECRVLFELFSTPRGKVSIGRVNSGEHSGRIVLLRELEPSRVSVIGAETELTRRFTHPQLLKLLGIFSDGERSYVASEYLPGVSLFELLSRVRARQTALGLGLAPVRRVASFPASHPSISGEQSSETRTRRPNQARKTRNAEHAAASQ